MNEVEPADLRDLFGQMRRDGRITSEIKKTRAALSVMFATALEDGVVTSNPVLGVRIPPPSEDEAPPDEKAKALTRAELGILLAALPSESRLFCTFLAHTGLRISEAVGLRWQHLDLGEHPKVRVREQLYKGKRKRLKSKDGKRDIPLSPGMARQLLALRRRRIPRPRVSRLRIEGGHSPAARKRLSACPCPRRHQGRIQGRGRGQGQEERAVGCLLPYVPPHLRQLAV
jgi:integrase